MNSYEIDIKLDNKQCRMLGHKYSYLIPDQKNCSKIWIITLKVPVLLLSCVYTKR